LIGIVAELLRTRNIGLNANHIPVPFVNNILADYISRPTNLNVSHFRADISAARINSDMGLFPSESRSLTEDHLRTLQQINTGPAKSPKDLGTIRTRRIQYLMWLHFMKWDADFTEMHRHPPRLGLLQLAMCAQHLETGSNLLCRTIRTHTIKRYVNVAASFHSLFGSYFHNYRKDRAMDAKISRTLSALYDEQERWKDVPNRRQPYTLEMLDTMTNDFAASGRGPNTLATALVDWCACGLFAGFRLEEWTQNADQSEITS
jgi:hypothetical protein